MIFKATDTIILGFEVINDCIVIFTPHLIIVTMHPDEIPDEIEVLCQFPTKKEIFKFGQFMNMLYAVHQSSITFFTAERINDKAEITKVFAINEEQPIRNVSTFSNIFVVLHDLDRRIRLYKIDNASFTEIAAGCLEYNMSHTVLFNDSLITASDDGSLFKLSYFEDKTKLISIESGTLLSSGVTAM